MESISGSSADTVGKLNPMRYRGYYEDTETGFYYLQSRYYNPDMCRFLNADDTEMLLTHAVDVIGINLFSYSNNNPINMLDKDGYSPLWAAIVNGYKFMNEVYKMYPGLVKNNDKFYTKYGFRIPDIINKKVVGEIKNVKYQALTKQIKGFLEISEKEGKQFVLVIKKGTRLSKPLVNAVKGASGIILEIGDGFVKMLSTPFFVTEDMFNIYYNSMPYSNNSRVCYN